MLSNEPLKSEQFVTHSGHFHLDDISAFSLLCLRNELLDLPHPELTRSRDAKAFESADWLVDVGGQYAVDLQRLDHHQFASQDSDRPRHTNGIALASAGMMWNAIGRTCIQQIAKRSAIELDAERLENLFIALDESTFQPIDAQDNGELKTTSQYTGLGTEDFPITDISLADLVRDYNSLHHTAEEAENRFLEISQIIKNFLHGRITATVREELAREFLKNGQLLETGKILLLEQGVPEEIDTIFHEAPPSVEFTVYCEEGKSEWEIRCTPLSKGSFEFKKGFPPEWRGLLSEATDSKPSFAHASGISEAVFCHGAGFFAKASSREAALQLATIASQSLH